MIRAPRSDVALRRVVTRSRCDANVRLAVVCREFSRDDGRLADDTARRFDNDVAWDRVLCEDVWPMLRRPMDDDRAVCRLATDRRVEPVR